MSTKTLMTIEEFARMRTADTEAYELLEGELVPLSSGTPKHARIRRRVERLIEDYFERNPIGEPLSEVYCQVSVESVRRPDVSVFLRECLSRLDLNQIPVPFAPDIAVEVLSLSEGALDINREVKEYLSGGCHEVWLLDHLNDEILVHTRSHGVRVLNGEELLDTPLLPEFSTRVRDLLA